MNWKSFEVRKLDEGYLVTVTLQNGGEWDYAGGWVNTLQWSAGSTKEFAVASQEDLVRFLTELMDEEGSEE